MPKKFTGENSKAAAARTRKEEAKQAEKAMKDKAADDAYWADDDKKVNKKMAKKNDEEAKKAEALRRKEENRKALEQEMNSLQGRSGAPTKVTVAAIESKKALEKRIADEEALRERLASSKIHVPSDNIEENVNVLDTDAICARSVGDAIAVLAGSEDLVDKHPEKRMKAAYETFAEANLPRLKMEHPTLRLSQLKQLLKKEWQKSAENPLNAKLFSLS